MRLASVLTRLVLVLAAALALALPGSVLGEGPGNLTGRAVLLDGGSYHLGDGKFNRYAADEALLAQEVVGPKYSVAFRVDKDGKISIRIGKVLGVDSGSTLEIYTGIKAGGTVYLERLEGTELSGRKALGLLEPRHNQAGFETGPFKVKAGTYLVTVESNPYTLFDRDDIQVEQVAVTTDELGLTVEPVWPRGKVYSGKLDLSLVPVSEKKDESLGVELSGPPPRLEEPPTPAPSVRGRGKEGLDLDLEVEGRGGPR
jgi:hypothetical protein